MATKTVNKKQAIGHEVQITVSETKFNQTTEEKKLIQIRPFATDPAHITVKLGRTINLGNFESAKIEVALTAPCYVEECKLVYDEVMDFVQERISAEVSKITEHITRATVEEDLE